MKKCFDLIIQLTSLLFFYSSALANTTAGFALPDSVTEMQLRFKKIRDLIVIPVTINKTVHVNLILDTGCRSLVLFGKKFEKLLNVSNKVVGFSGLGAGHHVEGHLSVGNTVEISSIVGRHVALVVVPDRNLLATMSEIDGVIGYEIFIKFEIEIDSKRELLKFRPALASLPPFGYAQIPLQIIDSRPVMDSQLFFSKTLNTACDLMIDTGSTLGLLLKTGDLSPFSDMYQETVVGRGFNGLLKGYKMRLKKMILNGIQMDGLPINVVGSDKPSQASIGMSVLKDYIVVINYCKAYACFKAQG